MILYGSGPLRSPVPSAFNLAWFGGRHAGADMTTRVLEPARLSRLREGKMMAKPIILAVDTETKVSDALERDLPKRYGSDYTILVEGSSTASTSSCSPPTPTAPPT